MNKKKLTRALTTVLFAVMLVLLVFYIYNKRQDFAVILTIPLYSVVLLIMLVATGHLFAFSFRRIAAGELGVKLSFLNWYGFPSVMSVAQEILPMRGDLLVAATYYKKVCGLPYSHFVAITSGAAVIEVFAIGLEMAAALLIIGFTQGIWPWVLWVCVLLLLLGMGIFIALTAKFGDAFVNRLPFKKILSKVASSFVSLMKNPRLFFKYVGVVLMKQLFNVAKLMVIFKAIGLDAGLPQAFIYVGIIGISSLFSILPGNLGIKEAALGLGAVFTGGAFDSGVIISLILRIATLMESLIMAAIFIIPVMRQLRAAQAEDDEDKAETEASPALQESEEQK